jgi:exodeoxyribonuclease VII large subunit
MTVSQLTALVKQALQASLPSTVHVVGEISNFKRHGSGHLYFTLKDAGGELSCVMWRSAAEGLKFRPEDGMEAIATGTVDVFERSGRYQLYARKLEPRGIGALELAFRQLCEKLAKEGLFEAGRKRPLPRFPARIALVTSPTGAVIADLLHTLSRRFPCIQVVICPVRVQGNGAAAEIAAAIRLVNEHAERLGGVDLVIVGRGGGSLEDLWAFNEEIVARAMAASRIPVMSAVGHEADVTIADLVADASAATPTAAAELAVPVLDDVLADLQARQVRMIRSVSHRVELNQTKLSAVFQRAAWREPLGLVYRREQLVDELFHRALRGLTKRWSGLRVRLDRVMPTLEQLLPHQVLLRCTNRLHELQSRIGRIVARRESESQRRVSAGTLRLEQSTPLKNLHRSEEYLRRWKLRAALSLRHRLEIGAERSLSLHRRLTALGYKSILSRGFSITRSLHGRRIIRSVADLSDGARIITEISDGEVQSEVVNLFQRHLFD